ncbi:sorbosone dehydrogenase [Puteibacter caeruleilacunae]|nr:sorbosone dehydrogenase [Puteibacter caeruleilacunae]
MQLTLLITKLLICSALLSCQSNGHKEQSAYPTDPNNVSLQLPEGFHAFIVTDQLGRGRHITINTNGDMYVSLRQKKNDKGAVALRDTNGDGRADVIEYFSDINGTSIRIFNGYLYQSDDMSVFRTKLSSDHLVPQDNPEVIATGFINQNQHSAKTFCISDEGNLFVNVGAPSNACMESSRTKGSPGMDPCPQLERQAGIWKFKADILNQNQSNDAVHYAKGIRNAVALCWNEKEQELYAVQHGRDQLSQFFPELFDDEANAQLPAEEFFLVEEGSNCGWPYCYYDQLQDKKVLAPEYGGDGNKIERCNDMEMPIMAFPGHLAPNDLLFYTGNQFPERYKDGAFIAFHGSWNRAPLEQEGFFVVFVPMRNGLPSGTWEIFANGFAGEKPINSPRDANHRPCGLAQAPDGSLLVVDSQQGSVYRIFYQEK